MCIRAQRWFSMKLKVLSVPNHMYFRDYDKCDDSVELLEREDIQTKNI